MSADSKQTIVLRCDLDGIVEQFVSGYPAHLPMLRIGESFTRVASPGAIPKVLKLLDTLRSGAVVLGVELTVEVDHEMRPLRIGGFRVGESLLIGGTFEEAEQPAIIEDLLRTLDEQETALRFVTKQQYDAGAEQSRGVEAEHYNELTRLNNELINLQRELMRKNRELERLNTVKNELLGMVAHDLRTPLTVINLYSQYIFDETGGALGGEKAMIGEILAASEFMLKLVNNLVDLATIESGRLQLECQPVDIVLLLAHNMKLNAMLAQRKGINIVLDIAPDLPLVFVDAPKIEQVLNNLASNAVKFSPPNSTVFVSAHRRDDFVTVTVRDKGPGIPMALQDKLFHPFGRISPRTPDGEKNSGLGLVICRRIVEGHGGTIILDSDAGAGTAFSFTLPVATGKPVGAANV